MVLKRTAPEGPAAAAATNPEVSRPCSPRPRAPGPGRGAPAAALPARAPGRCGAGPGARRPSRRVYTPDGGFSPIPFSTSSIRSSSITTVQGESASAARPCGATAGMGPVSSCPAWLLSPTHRRHSTPLPQYPSHPTLLPTQPTAEPSSHRPSPLPGTPPLPKAPAVQHFPVQTFLPLELSFIRSDQKPFALGISLFNPHCN